MPDTNGGNGNDRWAYRELGATGLSRFGGVLNEEPLRELQGTSGRRIYQMMRNNDPVISAIFFSMIWAMKHVSFFAEPAGDEDADMEASQFVDECLNDMSFSWQDELDFILTMWEYGYSLVEVVGKKRLGANPPRYAGLDDPAASQYNDGRWAWRKWAPRPADTVDQWMFDDAGGIQGFVQVAPPDNVPTKIPIDRLLLFRTSVAPKNSPESISILRAMYHAWYYSHNIQEIEGIGIERDLAGLPVIYLGAGCTLEGTNSDYEKAKALVRNIRRDEQEGVVIPRPKLGSGNPGEGMLLELLSSVGGRQFNTDQVISRYNKLKAMTCLAQWIMLGMEQVGAFSLGKMQGDMFNQALSGWADSICDVITRYAIPRLFAYNPGVFKVEQLPKLSHSEVGAPDLAGISDYVNKLVQATVLTPGAELEDYLRNVARLPDKPEPKEGEAVPTPPKKPAPPVKEETPEEPQQEEVQEEPEDLEPGEEAEAASEAWYHLQGKHDQKNHAGGGGSIDAPQSVRNVESDIRRQHSETAAFFDSSGNEVYRKSNPYEEGRIHFDSDEVEAMQSMPGLVSTHNHPAGLEYPDSDPRSGGRSFSREDIYLASKVNMGEIRAVSNKYTHSMKPKGKGWPSKNRIDEVVGRVSDKVMSDFKKAIETGKMTPEQADNDHNHETWRRASRELGLQYARQRTA